jgi:hypothetical protein
VASVARAVPSATDKRTVPLALWTFGRGGANDAIRSLFCRVQRVLGLRAVDDHREFFTEWIQMQRFMRQLKQSAVLDYGETQAQSAPAKVAA